MIIVIGSIYGIRFFHFSKTIKKGQIQMGWGGQNASTPTMLQNYCRVRGFARQRQANLVSLNYNIVLNVLGKL